MRLFLLISAFLFFIAPPEAFAEVPAGGRLKDYSLVDQDGRAFVLGGLYGKPLVLSFIFTSCTHTCGTLTASLKEAFEAPGSGFGTGFRALTVGFDAERDTPEALSSYGRRYTGDFNAWRFASSDGKTIDELIREAGFAYRKTEGGFDHPNMAVVIGPDGRVFSRLYGDGIAGGELMSAVEASRDLKSPAYGKPLSGIISFLKSICYAYDEKTGTYGPDYGFLMIVALGAVVHAAFAGIALYIFYSARRRGAV